MTVADKSVLIEKGHDNHWTLGGEKGRSLQFAGELKLLFDFLPRYLLVQAYARRTDLAKLARTSDDLW